MAEGRAEIAVAAAESVDALPAVVQRAMQVMYSSHSGVQELAAVIGLDPALTGKLLKLVNSAYYRTLARPVTSLREAILRLGYRAVQSALLTTATMGLARLALPSYELPRTQFWQHSIAVAFSAREIALATRQASAEEAYVAGLLHDIGKVGLDRKMAAGMTAVRSQVSEQRLTYHEAEKVVLGFDHAHVGELVAMRWRLPASTATAIGVHHRPTIISDALPAIVTTANTMAWTMGFPGTGDKELRSIDTALDRLGLTTAALEEVVPRVVRDIGDAMGWLNP